MQVLLSDRQRKTRRNKLVEIKSPFLDIANFICFADYFRSNKSFICVSAVYRVYLDIVFPDADCRNSVFYF